MKSFSVFLVLTLAVFSAAAQADTNTPAAVSATNGAAVQADTNMPATQVETNLPAAQPGTNTVAIPANTMATATTRPMSLQDCIQEALQHNLDVQIERTAPEISLYNLNSGYGGYDATLNVSGDRTYSKQGAYVNDSSQVILPTAAYQDVFNAGLSGATPWGMTYVIGNGPQNGQGNITESWGQKSLGSTTTNYNGTSGSIGVNLTQPLLKNFWIDKNRLT